MCESQSEQSRISLWQVDAFADRPFTGNPAAICLLDRFPHDRWMQDLAAEMNLSETAFVVPTDQANGFQLRWFTPLVEVDLCGHATLAAAHTLYEQNRVEPSAVIRFQTRSGELICQRVGEQIMLDFPTAPILDRQEPETAEAIARALGTTPTLVARTEADLLVVLDDPAVLRNLKPDFGRLAKIKTRGIAVTARSDQTGIDFISRFFAPRFGINEDPVTGSAHCALAPYWCGQLGVDEVVGFQASRRGGRVRCRCAGDRVELIGQAITVMHGNFHFPP
ncbi:PhzF family phenazine biosynthesis protein [Stieleria sp. TO1_6]|nr:PhzF family phenazine biosynthesis protein [Stieleria tagensis]